MNDNEVENLYIEVLRKRIAERVKKINRVSTLLNILGFIDPN